MPSGRPASLNQASTRPLVSQLRHIQRIGLLTSLPQQQPPQTQTRDEGLRHTSSVGTAPDPGHGQPVPQAQVGRGEHGHLPQVQGQVRHLTQG